MIQGAQFGFRARERGSVTLNNRSSDSSNRRGGEATAQLWYICCIIMYVCSCFMYVCFLFPAGLYYPASQAAKAGGGLGVSGYCPFQCKLTPPHGCHACPGRLCLLAIAPPQALGQVLNCYPFPVERPHFFGGFGFFRRPYVFFPPHMPCAPSNEWQQRNMTDRVRASGESLVLGLGLC